MKTLCRILDFLLTAAALTAAALAATGSPAKPATLAIQPIVHPDTEASLAQMKETASHGGADIVFIGDELTNLWDENTPDVDSPLTGFKVWEKVWAPLRAANFGLGGDRTENVLWRIDQGMMDGLKPKVIVLLIGKNNIVAQGRTVPELPGVIYHCTPKETAEGVKAIIDRLQKKCPTSKIVLLGIFPMGPKDDKIRLQIRATNSIIRNYEDNRRVYYMDLSPKFLTPAGAVNLKLLPDSERLSGNGYQVWADAILPKMLELMK